MAAPYIVGRSLIALKEESVEGTPETLADADVIAPVFNQEYTPNYEMHEREVMQDSLSRLASVTGERSGSISYAIELKGSGSAGTALNSVSRTLQACGMSETTVPIRNFFFLFCTCFILPK